LNIIEIKDLKVTFEMSGMRITALHGVDIELRRGEVLGILGESGSGKTVLLHSIFRILPENARVSGEILYRGMNLLSIDQRRAKDIIGRNFALVPQGFGSLNPLLKCWLQISERPMEHHGMRKEEGLIKARHLLRDMGVDRSEGVANSYRHQLSGGMLQRVLIAMGISGPSEAVFLDEPTKGLDQRKKRLVIELIKLARRRTDSMMVVSHDLDFLREISDRICVLYCGDVVEIADAASFFKSPKHPYSSALLRSLPSGGLKPIEGEAPSMASPPSGCKFHPRCPHRAERCSKERPPLAFTDGGAVRCFNYAQGR
jgi:peptide/nickel transport system ATP-binding protein